jgi:cytochrome c biogenesis protein CcmG/thiol:disulfide interchange protein DsbE
MNRFLIPLAVFGFLIVLLGIGLHLNPHEVPSPLINKPAPNFQLSQLQAPDKIIAPQDLKGQVWLLNVWASWCESCRLEHALLMDLSSQHLVAIVGLNYRDSRLNGINALRELGNPYQVSGFDADGRVGIDYGVYGVPETFVIDKAGVIRYKQIGVLTPEAIAEKLIPLIKELNRA